MKAAQHRSRDTSYEQGEIPWPLGSEEWVNTAAKILPRSNFDWLEGGAGQEWTLQANREAFKRWRLRPRFLANNPERDLSVGILGKTHPLPILLAPIGGQTVVHPEGELATARAAQASSVPLIISTASSYPMEVIANEMGDTPHWYQLYWLKDREVVDSFIDRAIKIGTGAIVVTVDTPATGWRDRDLRNNFAPSLLGAGLGQYRTDPAFRRRLGADNDDRAISMEVTRISGHFDLSWDDLSWLRERVSVPLLIKGLLTAEDAVLATEAGFDGVIVSNHGGRQLDGSVASLDALLEIRGALGDDAQILVDGGIRRGTDVLKAISLGANAVLLGRPFMYGLATAGEAGVAQVLKSLIAEIDLSLGLAGAESIRQLDRSFVTEAPCNCSHVREET